MKIFKQQNISIFVLLVIVLLTMTSCDDDFYLSEHEVKTYESIFESEALLNSHFSNLAGHEITLTFSNSSGTPRLQSTNLLSEMRRTPLSNLESGLDPVSLDRLNSELETQIEKWVEGRLSLYTNSSTNDQVSLTRLNTIRVRFLNDPTFSFHPETQAIQYDMNLRLVIDGEIRVNAVSWLVNIFTNINGTYPLRITLPNLRLNGEAKIHSLFSNAGRIKFQMIPQIVSQIQVTATSSSIPNAVKTGVRDFLSESLSKRVDEVFLQEYDHFALPQISLTPQIATSATSLKVSYRSKSYWNGPSSTPPQLHVVSRASDGKLYHARKSDGGWSNYSRINFPANNPSSQTPIASDPALFHSGNNQLELAAVNQNGELVYSHWRDEKWVESRFVSSNSVHFEGKPSIVATAKGQAEIFVEGDDGNLWHHRRINGNFVAPQVIPINGFPNLSRNFHDPKAVFVGNKIVVIFADGQNHLAAIAFDIETRVWGQPTVLRDKYQSVFSIVYSPTAVASGENRIDVAYSKSGGYIYHQILYATTVNFQPGVGSTGIGVSGNETNIPGKTNVSPVISASTFQQPELIVRGTDNVLYHNFFNNLSSPKSVDGRTLYPGWQEWNPLRKNIRSKNQHLNGTVSNFAAVGTRNGKTEVIARALPKFLQTDGSLFHNEFLTERFGRSTNPWKTIHWRGWDSISTDKFVGEPAIVALERSFLTANVGSGNGYGTMLYTQNLSDINDANFLGIGLSINTNNSVIDPIILSTGIGTYDTFVYLKTGSIRHNRFYRNGQMSTKYIAVPNGEKATGLSAVTYGNGFIDLVATTNAKNVHHWNFRNTNWNQPDKIADQIASKPILVNTGAGQLELLAVDASQQLVRRKYSDNSWGVTEYVPHDFPINHKTFAIQSASSWGDGSIDLAVVGYNSNLLYHRRIGPENSNCSGSNCPTPRKFVKVGSGINDAPVLTAFSPTHLNILSMQGLRWYSNSSEPKYFQVYGARDPLIQWKGTKYIGGDELIIGGAANTGANNFAAIAVGDGKFYSNRSVGKGWSGFIPIEGQDSKNILRQPIFLPAISSYGN